MTYSPSDRHRISQFVRGRERWQDRIEQQSPLGPNYARPAVAQANENIGHGEFGEVTLMKANVTETDLEEQWKDPQLGNDVYEVFNPFLQIWSGAWVLIAHCALANQPSRFNIIQHWSATLCQFKTKTNPFGALPASTVRTCTVVKPLNGHYGASQADVESINVTVNYNIGEQIDILAELCYDSLKGTPNFWQLYSTDCEPP